MSFPAKDFRSHLVWFFLIDISLLGFPFQIFRNFPFLGRAKEGDGQLEKDESPWGSSFQQWPIKARVPRGRQWQTCEADWGCQARWQ